MKANARAHTLTHAHPHTHATTPLYTRATRSRRTLTMCSLNRSEHFIITANTLTWYRCKHIHTYAKLTTHINPHMIHRTFYVLYLICGHLLSRLTVTTISARGRERVTCEFVVIQSRAYIVVYMLALSVRAATARARVRPSLL